MFIFLMLISLYLFIYLSVPLYILLTVGVIPFKVLPTLINVDVDVEFGCWLERRTGLARSRDQTPLKS